MDRSFDSTLAPSAGHWKRIGYRHHHGIALPLFSIRNPTSCGIGEFLDLIPLIHWCKSIGLDIIQLLPLNDSGHDPSPYSAHSAMALHPIYLSLKDLPFSESFQSELLAITHYNTSKRVKYHKVLEAKEAFLRIYFHAVGSKICSQPAYQAFAQEQWVKDYAEYKVLKAQNNERPWWQWTLTQQPIQEACEYHIFVQFLCFQQMQEVKRVADQVGLFIKGDIPILINRDSADVWKHQELFILEYAAGAPPDMYSEEGQYWGFPLYNWQALEETDYSWWKKRLQLAEKLYHIYRLDHIVGFFKIWAIAEGKKAKEGFFIPEDPALWVPQGKKILTMMLESCKMLPIGEDLGAVPQEVRACMNELGISGTKVMRWERKWQTDASFIPPDQYPPLSMTCLSTHDSETLDMWWEKFPQDAQAFAHILGRSFSEPLDIETRQAVLRASHQSTSLFHINLLQEYLNVFDELAWATPDDDRINIPGQVLDSNWTYRFLPTLETIISHKALSSFIKSII